MNLLNIIDEELSSDETYILDEGIFSVSPAIAMFAFKDTVVNKLKSAAEKVSHPVSSAIGTVAVGAEKLKAKTKGRSGDKDDDTVYSLTKEQKQAMSYIYKKYGAQLVNDIEKFRMDVMVPYSIIKRNVARNKTLTNKEILGMTKEEYYKYRESGRRKIEKKGTYFKDSKDLRRKQIEARDALITARKKYQDFRDGKIIDLTAANIEKIFDEANIGRKSLNGWSDSELEKTATEIEKTLKLLKDPNRAEGEFVRVSGKAGNKSVTQSRAQLEKYLADLQERGYSYAKGISVKLEDKVHHGSFKEAFANYMLRKEKIKEIKNNSTNADFKKFYNKVLKDAIEAAQKTYNEKFNNYISLKGTVELNQYEKKIWGLKLTGREFSGNINDWYLKIKPEAFKETKYFEKSDKVIKAEKEMDKALKQLERKLKKVMSDEDLAYCRKYRLFSNFLTVKELRDPKNMFKGEAVSVRKSTPQISDDDLDTMIDSALSKEYDSIRALEDERAKIMKAAEGKKLTSEQKEKLNSLKERIDPKNGSKASKIDKEKLKSIISKINSKVYTGKTEAADDLKELEATISDFEEVNGAEELRPFEHEINKAKGKIATFINGGKNDIE